MPSLQGKGGEGTEGLAQDPTTETQKPAPAMQL